MNTLLNYVANALWQAPLLLGVAALAAWLLRPLGSRAQHRVWVLTLAAQTLLPALSLLDWYRIVHTAASYLTTGTGDGSGAHVAVHMRFQLLRGEQPVSPSALRIALALYLLAFAYSAARLLWQLIRLQTLARDTSPIPATPELESAWQKASAFFSVPNVRLAVSRRIAAPVTLGWRRPLLLLPETFLHKASPAQQLLVFAHECAHIARRDFLLNLVYELLALPIRFHPAAWPVRTRVAETREMICDAHAADLTGRIDYGRGLLDLAQRLGGTRPLQVPQAIGIFDTRTLERRIMQLAAEPRLVSTARRAATVLLGAALATGTCAFALGLHFTVAADDKSDSNPAAIQVAPGKILGNLYHKVAPIYPPEAKKKHVQGTVTLKAIIGKDGAIENLKVLSGPEALRQASLDAVKQWTYKPYLLNGEPVVVETEIKVIYTLGK